MPLLVRSIIGSVSIPSVQNPRFFIFDSFLILQTLAQDCYSAPRFQRRRLTKLTTLTRISRSVASLSYIGHSDTFGFASNLSLSRSSQVRGYYRTVPSVACYLGSQYREDKSSYLAGRQLKAQTPLDRTSQSREKAQELYYLSPLLLQLRGAIIPAPPRRWLARIFDRALFCASSSPS